METPNTIMNMIAAGESKRLEFKERNVSQESLGATICAFLNSGGGQILIGVRDDGTFVWRKRWGFTHYAQRHLGCHR